MPQNSASPSPDSDPSVSAPLVSVPLVSVPLVSVIVPTYNRAAMLPRALASISAQSYPALEIIVVDDGSTDETRHVVDSLQRTTAHPVQYIFQANQGCSSARNRGLDMARGTYIGLLDSDDEWLPDAVARLAAMLTESHADFVYSPAVESDVNGQRRINYPVARNAPSELAKELFLFPNVRNGALLFRRTFFDRVGRYRTDLRYNEDTDFLLRAALTGRASYLDEPTVVVHQHGGNKSNRRAQIHQALLISSQDLLRSHPDFARELGASAHARLQEIRVDLVRALVQEERYADAASLLSAGDEWPWELRLAVRWSAQWPLRARRRAGRLVARLRGVGRP